MCHFPANIRHDRITVFFSLSIFSACHRNILTSVFVQINVRSCLSVYFLSFQCQFSFFCNIHESLNLCLFNLVQTKRCDDRQSNLMSYQNRRDEFNSRPNLYTFHRNSLRKADLFYISPSYGLNIWVNQTLQLWVATSNNK